MLKTILKFNETNLNNRIYTEYEVLKILKNKEQLPGIMGYSNSNIVSLRDVCFTASNFFVENDILIADIKFFQTPEGKSLEKMVDCFVFRLNSIGQVDNITRKVVLNEIICISAVGSYEDYYYGILKEYNDYKNVYRNKLLMEKLEKHEKRRL